MVGNEEVDEANSPDFIDERALACSNRRYSKALHISDGEHDCRRCSHDTKGNSFCSGFDGLFVHQDTGRRYGLRHEGENFNLYSGEKIVGQYFRENGGFRRRNE